MRTFTRRIGDQQLFCTIELSDGFVTVTRGEVGTGGKRQSHPFADQAEAVEEHDRLIRQTLAEGFDQSQRLHGQPVAIER